MTDFTGDNGFAENIHVKGVHYDSDDTADPQYTELGYHVDTVAKYDHDCHY